MSSIATGETRLAGATIDSDDSRLALEKVHCAVWSTFPARTPRNVGTGPDLENVLAALGAVLPTMRRPLLAIALWNLFGLLREDGSPRALGEFLSSAIGPDFERVASDYGADADRLPLLARQCGLLDCRWSLRFPDDHSVTAEMQLSVQRPIDEMRAIADPAAWGGDGIFLRGLTSRPKAASSDPFARSWDASVVLPGVAADVSFDTERASTRLDESTKFSFTSGPFKACEGRLRVEKEPGRPGETRIVHVKTIRLADPPQVEWRDRVAYWVQAETLCLALPA